MKFNKEWHAQHRMPVDPTEEERAKWHIEHAKRCACRKPTPAISALIKKYGHGKERA